MKLRGIGTLLAAAALLASGCGSDSDDDADTTDPGSAAGSTSAAAPSSDPTDPFGPVRNPRVTLPVQQRPCEGFSPAQLAGYRMDRPGEVRMSEVTGFPRCRWQDSARTREITLEAQVVAEGLDNLYAKRGGYQVFDVIDVGGNPAAQVKGLATGPICFVSVLATDTEFLTVTFTSLGLGTEEPCGPARELALTALNNLQPLR